MVATGVFVLAAKGVVVTIRNSTVFVLPSSDLATQTLLQSEVLQEKDGEAKAAENDDDVKTKATQRKPPANRITAAELLCPQGSAILALLLIVDERRLVHYELNLETKSLVLKASRSVPRSATCMAVGHVKLSNKEIKYVIIVGQKTGEAVAMPFPDINRDLTTLLGHTTSMITDVAVNYDSSLLLTADRDEKLRVSRFPNAAIIESYCLGHAASVTKIACSIVTPALVVSTSMDNTLKLWQMSTGTLLASEVLLSNVEVSLDPLDINADNDNTGRLAAKSLINVSLAICPKTNIVAVLVNYEFLRLFSIVVANEVSTLSELEISSEDVKTLLAGEPCELLFTENEMLAVSYKKNPFLQLFTISASDKNCKLSPVHVAPTAFDEFRNVASNIGLVVYDEDKALDALEDGLKKKKARIGEWNKKILGANEKYMSK